MRCVRLIAGLLLFLASLGQVYGQPSPSAEAIRRWESLTPEQPGRDAASL